MILNIVYSSVFVDNMYNEYYNKKIVTTIVINNGRKVLLKIVFTKVSNRGLCIQ